jgi:penicillin-binding protein 1A
MILTLQLESRLSKEMILEHYLNRVYFGRGAYGITAAAKLHFNKQLEELTIGESAFLVGLIQAPSTYSSLVALGQKRMQHVLRRMYKVGAISSDVFISESISEVVQSPYAGESKGNPCIGWIMEQIPEWIRDSNKAIIVNTTLDTKLQKMIVSKIPEIKRTSRFDFTEMAFILCEVDGAVRVMIGGINQDLYGFNRAIQSVRPAGSTFKIYVYLAAFLKGMKPESVFDDSPPVIGKWSPSNYYHNEVGLITAEKAFSESVNGATVRIAMEYGLENVINTARLLGVNRQINNDCSLILGSTCISPYELAHTMLIIANDGEQIEPYCIKSIQDYETGQTIWEHREEQAKIKLIDNEEAFDSLRHIMSQVVESSRGTGRSIANSKYRIMAKTGTSQEYRDIWFTGMTETGVVFTAWCGNDSYSPMNRSDDPKKKNPAIEISRIALEGIMAGYTREEGS